MKCISIDPYNLKALLSLGVSYTNDLEEHRALNYLKTWLSNNPDYQNSTIAQSSQKVDEYLQFYGAGKFSSVVFISQVPNDYFFLCRLLFVVVWFF